jgi:DNA-binding NarL/FixJ family response regulator
MTTTTANPRKTKLQTMIDMLRQGATIAEIAAATQWRPHTVRGAMSGALKKRHGLKITSQVEATRGRIYSLPDTEIMFKSTRATCHTQAVKL